MDYITVNKKITRGNIEEFRKDPNSATATMERHDEEYGLLKKYLKEGDWILDIGTRAGFWMDLLSSKGYNVIGTDISEEAVQECINVGLDVVCVDAHDMSGEFGKNYFDAVTLIHTLEHCPYPDKVLNECYRVLKHGGILFVEVPIQVDESPELWGHYHCFENEDELLKLMIVGNGFTILEIQRMDPPSKKPWFRVVGRKNE